MRHLAVGVCIRPSDGALLVEHGFDRAADQRFYRAIGGTCEQGEDAASAVVREWQEEFALAMYVVRAVGELDNRFVYEGRAGCERVSVLEVAPLDPSVFTAARLSGRDPTGRMHTAEWVAPATLESGSTPLYPAGVLELLRTAG